jgi:hypothetical protein
MWSDLTTVWGDVNWWAVLVATLSTFAVGFLWYSRSFMGNTWQKLIGLSDSDIKSADMKVTMGGTFVATLISAWGLAVLEKLLSVDGWMQGARLGLFVGLVFVSTGWLVNSLYEQRSLKLWKINAGYATLALVVMGAILAAWPN